MSSVKKKEINFQSLPSIHENNKPVRETSNFFGSLEIINEDAVEEEHRSSALRRRASTFSGQTVSNPEKTKTIKRRQTIAGTGNSSLVNRFRKAAARIASSKRADGKSNIKFDDTSGRSQSPSQAGNRGTMSYRSQTSTSPEPSISRKRQSFSSVVGQVLWRRFSNTHGHKDHKAPEEDILWESADSEEDEDIKDAKQQQQCSGSFAPVSLSTEGQLALLDCYDEKLRTGLQKQYPRYKNSVYKINTKLELPLDESSKFKDIEHLSAKHDKEYIAVKVSHQLKRAGTLIDALKEERGEHTTSTPRRGYPRPKSRKLVMKYNFWTKSWASLKEM